MVRITTEDAKAIAIVAVGVGGIATVAYFVYSLANPGPKGGSCTTPGTPCYEALQAYQQEFQSCATQYSQLMQQIIASGLAPTSAQSQILSELRNCMDAAAANIAKTAYQYVPDTWSTLISQLLWEGLVIVLTAVGLQALLNYIKARMASGAIRAQPNSGAGIAAIIYEGYVQYAAQNSLITSLQASAWESAVGSFASDEEIAVGAYYNSLVSLGLISAAQAISLITSDALAIAVDASTTIAILSALPMTAYQEEDVYSVYSGYNPPYQEAGCGCQ